MLLNGLSNVETHYGVLGNKSDDYQITNILPIGKIWRSNFGAEKIPSKTAHFDPISHRQTPTLRLDDMFFQGKLGNKCPSFMKIVSVSVYCIQLSMTHLPSCAATTGC